MRNTSRLLWVIAIGSLIATVLYFGLALALAALLHRPSVPRTMQGIGVAVTVLAPICLAGFWIFRKLRAKYTRREALTAAASFAVFSPLALAAAIPVAAIPAGYAGDLWGPATLIGAFVSIALTLWLATLLPTVLILWVARRVAPRRT